MGVLMAFFRIGASDIAEPATQANSAGTAPLATKLRNIYFQGQAYLVTDDTRAFCKVLAKEGRAGIEFAFTASERANRRVSDLSVSYMKDSPFKGMAFDQQLICSSCLTPISRYAGSPPRKCPACGDARGLNIYDSTDPVVTEEDIEYIREFARAKAEQWWASREQADANCEWYCDENLDCSIQHGEGYLITGKLACATCCDKIMARIDDLRQRGLSLNGHDPGLLRLARKYHDTDILGTH